MTKNCEFKGCEAITRIEKYCECQIPDGKIINKWVSLCISHEDERLIPLKINCKSQPRVGY